MLIVNINIDIFNVIHCFGQMIRKSGPLDETKFETLMRPGKPPIIRNPGIDTLPADWQKVTPGPKIEPSEEKGHCLFRRVGND
jgi:hypothetical protein